MNKKLSGLYIVTPDWDNTTQLLTVSELALQGGASILQYRHKTAETKLRKTQASLLAALCRAYGCPFIINDHIDLCQEIDADGIHVGATDVSVAQARAALGESKIVGASCYGNLELARQAKQQGANYIALGGFYASRIKKYEVTTPISMTTQAKHDFALPTAVIGGMTVDNALPLITAGADMVAVISNVYFSDHPKQAAKALSALFSKVVP